MSASALKTCATPFLKNSVGLIVFILILMIQAPLPCHALAAKADTLIKQCSHTLPLTLSDDLYFIDVHIKSADNIVHKYKFLFDTGYSESAMSPKVCKEIGCVIVGKQKINPITNITVQKTSAVSLRLGEVEFKRASLNLDETSTLQLVHADGVIGGDVILKNEMIVSLKSNYLCLPKAPIYQLAKNLKWQKVEAVYDKGRVWVNFTANGKEIRDYFLDTGSDTTSLLEKDIESLKLEKLGTEMRSASEHGLHSVEKFGPIEIRFAGNIKTLKSCAKSSDSGLRKLGTDALNQLILGFDPESKYIFVGH